MPSLLASVWPALGERIEHVTLGDFPTPVERLTTLEAALRVGPLYVKRDDISARVYGGNKVRTLEVLFGFARAAGMREIVATGAFGSNHAVATVLHAPAAGLRPGAVLFPQPESFAALENLRVTLARAEKLVVLPNIALLPFGMWRARGAATRIMLPGGATPHGALGYVAAAFELAEQVARGELDEPKRIYVGIGSTCTTAGLVLGFVLAARLGVGFRKPPIVVAVRVTPWPVTSRFRILGLAVRTGALLAELANDPSLALSRGDLTQSLVLDGRQLGPGYGRPSRSGLEALDLFRERGLFALDTTYSSKAAAGFLAGARERRGEPAVFWSTKSTQPLPAVTEAELAGAPSTAKRWIERARGRVTPA